MNSRPKQDHTESLVSSEEELMKNSLKLFANDFYRELVAQMIPLLKASKNKDYLKDKRKHLNLQHEIMKIITLLDDTASRLKKEAKANNAMDEDTTLHIKRILIASRAFRQIADGLAWRSMNYSRFVFRVLSQAQSPGFASSKDEGREEELNHAYNVVRNGAYILLHDATNILRVGDLSALGTIPSASPYIGEVKKGRDVIAAKDLDDLIRKGMPVKKQSGRVYQAQVMITTRSWYTEDGVVGVYDIKPVNHDYLSSVGALLKKAINQGFVSKRINPYLYVEAMDVTKTSQVKLDEMRQKTQQRPHEKHLFSFSNYTFMNFLEKGEVARSNPPYSIFPFKAEIIAKLISGELILNSWILEEPLRRELQKYGWSLIIKKDAIENRKVLTQQERDAELSGVALFPDDMSREDFIGLESSDGFSMPATHLIMGMGTEFTSVQYVVSIANQIKAMFKPGETGNFFYDTTENTRWQ